MELVHHAKGGDWKFERVGGFEHPYPTTKIVWRPDADICGKDQLATTGDYLRLWTVKSDGSGDCKEEHLFNTVSNKQAKLRG